MQDLEQRLKDSTEMQHQAETKNHLRMNDRIREFEQLKDDFIKNVTEKNKKEADAETRK